MGRNVPRLWPLWTRTIGAMRAESVLVKAVCRECETAFKVDLDALIAVHGPAYCLIDKLGACRVWSCDGRCLFLYSPAKSTPFRPLLN